jgi:eukaryotic translation initiation factor 2C
MVEVVVITCHFSDMSAKDFIEPFPTIDFVAQLLDSEMYSSPLSDAEQVRVFSFI